MVIGKYALKMCVVFIAVPARFKPLFYPVAEVSQTILRQKWDDFKVRPYRKRAAAAGRPSLEIAAVC